MATPLDYFFTALGFAVQAALIALGPVSVAMAVLRPVDHAIRTTRARLQFELTDFVWLLVQVQISLAAVVGYVPRREEGWFTIFLGFTMAATLALWWGATQAMLRAGVRGKGRRAAFVLLVLPATLLVAMGGTIFFMGVAFAVTGRYDRYNRYSNWPDLPAVGWRVAFVIAMTLGLVGVVWGLRRLVFWILASPERKLRAERAASESAHAAVTSSAGLTEPAAASAPNPTTQII